MLQWFEKVVKEVGVEDCDVHQRFRACLDQWERICSHLPKQLAQRILNIIKNGYKIKWLPGVDPDKLRHDCKRNPPMMSTRVDETWKTFAKCLKIGAIKPFDARKGKPNIICPVFFVDEGTKLRVVHNLKWTNAHVDPAHFPVWLETILRMRGIFPLMGWMTVADFKNAYFHVPFEKKQHLYIAFALTEDEMPKHAVQ